MFSLQNSYISLLPLYFPRSEREEEYAAYQLPEDVGNENGEPVIKERQIRITGKPAYEAQSECFIQSTAVIKIHKRNICINVEHVLLFGYANLLMYKFHQKLLQVYSVS